MDLHDYNPFALDKAWSASIFTALTDNEHKSLLDLDQSLDLPLLSSDNNLIQGPKLDALIDIDLDNFTYGQLEDFGHLQDARDTNKLPETASSEPKVDDLDLWSSDALITSEPTRPRLRTWEAFVKQEESQESTSPYISEAGVEVWDAVLAEKEDCASDVIQPAAVLKSLALLAQGRPSILFRIAKSGDKFELVRDNLRTQGVSTEVFKSLVNDFAAAGLHRLFLSQFVRKSHAARNPSPVRISLAASITEIFSVLDRETTTALRNVKSIIQTQAVFAGPHEMIDVLSKFARACEDSPEQNLLGTIVSLHREITDAAHPFAPTVHQVVSRLVNLFSKSLQAQSGLRVWPLGIAASLDQKDVSAHVGSGSAPGARNDVEQTIFVLLTDEEKQRALEIVSGLEIIRASTDQHSLIGQDRAIAVQSTGYSGEGDIDTDSILIRAQQYESQVMQVLADFRAHGQFQDSDVAIPDAPVLVESDEQAAWLDDERQQDFFALVGNRFSEALTESRFEESKIARCLTMDLRRTAAHNSLVDTSDLESASQDLIASWRPLIMTQSRLVNGSVLRLLLRDCGLIKHLQVQFDFHLFGNAAFRARLCDALFSSASESAERKRGVTPASHNLGLRLDAREGQHWPPASSELRLSLAGLLNETYHNTLVSGRKSSDDIPGGLSFAIRELDDAEIDVIVNPGSIHALDFLKLSYTPPAALKSIITDTSLTKYDEMFRFLLQLLRLHHLTTDLKALHIHSRSSSPHAPTTTKFILIAHHLISTLTSHIFTLSISTSWSRFLAHLTKLQSDLAKEDTSQAKYGSKTPMTLSRLSTLHDRTLDTVRTRTFLRRKQSAIKESIYAMLGTILAAAPLLRVAHNNNYNANRELKKEEEELKALLERLEQSAERAIAALEARERRGKGAGEVSEDYDYAADDMAAGENESFGILAERLKGAWFGRRGRGLGGYDDAW